jgi:hypothetical protein
MYGSNGYSPTNYGAPPPPQGYSSYGAAYAPYPGQSAPGMMNPMATPKNGGLAVALELLGGFFFQTFGVGHLYAGNVGMGLGLMFGYWALTALNLALCFIVVGFVTWPLTWLAFMIISAITASNAAKKFNMQAFGRPF